MCPELDSLWRDANAAASASARAGVAAAAAAARAPPPAPAAEEGGEAAEEGDATATDAAPPVPKAPSAGELATDRRLARARRALDDVALIVIVAGAADTMVDGDAHGGLRGADVVRVGADGAVSEFSGGAAAASSAAPADAAVGLPPAALVAHVDDLVGFSMDHLAEVRSLDLQCLISPQNICV